MCNEELVAAYRAGDTDALLALWGQVRRLVLKFAINRGDIGRLELDDLMQVGFIAMMEAADTYNGGAAFSTWLGLYIKKEFNIACGQRTEKQRREPLLNSNTASLDEPLTDDEDSGTLGDMVSDPEAAAAFEAVEEADRKQTLYAALMDAVEALPKNQQQAVKGMYWKQESVDSNDLNDALKRLRHPSVSRQLRNYMREGG